ncbi:LPD38 domain-containing protein [Phocaeicola coprophilus]|uniref:LPD38 domain-containing protein n=1 Tax=Phocaeicola coprophilus TaxID=387090 RepID=UPI0026DC2DA5|nr:LPD38 domain-containing protein [Phocaeicola coprophilus]
MEDNKTRVLYDRLTQDGYDIGDFDSFSKNVQDEAKRKSLYETITNDGYDVGDFDSFSSKLVARSQEEPVTNVTTQNVQPQVQPVHDMPSYDPKTQGYILENVPDMFRSKGNNLATRPLPQQDLFENNSSDLVRKIGIDQQQRVEQAQKSANDPYMKEQNLELFKRQNQEQINSVNELINAARQERAKERQQRVRSVGDGGILSTMSQAYLAGEQNDTDKQLEYASTLMEQAQNITNEAKKKGNTNFFARFARGFKDAPLDGWAMGLQDLKNYSAAKKVMDKVDKGEELTPSEDALMQALVTNAATQMYYSGDLGRGYKAGGVTAESLPFMLDMIAGMGAVQALTKPVSKAIVKYAADKAAQMGLGRATTGLAKGAARTVAGLGDVAAHTATFGNARVAADYQRRGLGDVQVKPNADGTVSYDGRENVQTGAEALGKSIISTAAETGSELLGEYFAPMLGYIGRVTGANKVGKIIPASVGKAFKDVVNSQGFREMQEIARRAKISDPLGEYAEEVANNLVSTAIGDMTPEQLVDLDQNIDTFLGVAPMSALFGAAGTGGYLRDKYKNYRNMRNFETQMQDAMGEDWSGVREALQDADIETARNMVKDVLSSPMSPDMKKNAIKYISSVLQEQTLQEADKQMMPEEIAFEKKNIINNLNETRSKISLNDEELNAIINSEEGYQAIISQFDPETANNIMKYKQAYDDFVNYNYWVQDQADNARRQAEAQVESLTNATTGTIMRVNNKLTKNPVNVLRGNLVFDNEGKVDENQSDKTIYYMSEDGRVKMAPVSMFSSLVDNTPAEEMIQRAGNDAQEEVLQAEEAQINSIPAQEQQPIGPETRFTMGGNNYEVNRVTPDGYEVYLLDENGTPAQSQLMSEEEIRNAINGQQPANAEETQPSVTEQTVQEETSEQPVQENQTAMSRIPLNERGEQDFEAAPVADTSAALLEISDNVDDAKDTVTQMIEYYNDELKKVEKKKSSGNTIQGIIETKKAKKAINDKISYWNQVAADLEAKRPTGLIAQAEEKAKENQQRLASMTSEEQQAAQQEVQKKIDAGAFERKEPRKKVRYVKEDADLGPSITPQEHVLREIATGRVSFSLSDTEGAQGLSSHLGYSNSPEERKKLVWALSSDGLTPEAAAEQIHADMPENLQGMVTDQDVFNMIINAFQEYGSPSKMWDAAKNMHGTDIEENIPGYEEDQERQLIEWEASENRMSVPEWIAYSDYIEEELNNLYSSVTDEELNTIFEQIINDYERRAETESAGSTEGQTDSEQGNTVQPERESDNEGRTGEVEEQPEPANKTDGESGSVVPEPEGTVKTDIEAARAEVDQNPTEAQKEAGNYKKGHVKIDGYDVTIENPKGSVRSGKDADGNEWSVTMNNDYGYIRGTEGVDGDHIDVFLSDNPETGDVFVIDQVNPDGTFDEHKVMYGFKSALAAKRAYMANYSKGWTGLGNITRVSKEEFKKWVNSSHRKTKPFAEYKSVVPVSEKETTTNAEDTPAKSNNIVSDERYQELKNRLKQKLGQLNSGIDPEIIAIGAEMAVYHIERGAVKFADYCKAMVDDLGDVIRPYLKSFYSSARYMPQSIENGLSERMSPDSEVSQFDVTNFDKSVPDVMQQIENVAKEKKIEKATSSNDVKKSPSDLFGNSEEYQKKAEQEKEAVSIIGVKIAEKAIAKRNGEQVDPLTMKEVKDILKGYDMLSDMSATDMQELVELAMTNETRLIAESYINGDATKQKQGYDTIVDMYNMQPLLNARDSTRFERQQYSTPTPFGYVMGQFVKDGKTVESVLEPSAGNGALTIAFPANTVHVNDIDERRLENLRTLGYAQVTNQDALIPFEGSVDAVLTNPPFGSTTAKEFDDGQIKISSLEGLMAINALESMKDNGRAAIVIGGNTSYRDNGAMQSKDMKLFAYLYSHYNVVDVINLNGDMYKRNGTKYDVRIILINGRKTGPFKLIAPPVKSKARAEQINSFEELYNRVQDDIRSLQQMGDLFNGTEGETRTTDTEGSGANNNVSNRPKSGERGKSVRPDKKVGSNNDMGSTGNTTVSGPEQAERSTAEENAGKLDTADRSDAGSVEPVQEQRGSDNGGSTGGSRNDGSVRSDSGDNTGRSRLSVNLSDEKVPYPNRSQSGTLMSVVPANQAQVLADSLANIGDVDQFLVDQLGYSSKDELFSYLAAEQIDSVSLAINQMNKGNGFIIGDMTGVGKGRQGAALIRYAVRKGYNPIYFTQKPALFSDNYRDLADIGSGDLRPFIIASDPKNAAITDASGNVVHKLPTDKEKKRVFDYIMKNGKLPEEYDYVITTYSQINNGTKEYEPKEDGIAEKDKSYKKKSPSAADKSGQERRDVIQALSKDNIMILDESHTAGGSGGGSMYMQYIMPKVKGVTFLSATFAKRADNMPIYAMKTDLSKSGISPQDMIEAISQGGVTLQEIMSKQLVQSGQMIRRERSFQGVTIDWMPVSEEEDAVQRKQFDEVSSIFSDIRAFQKDYITPIVEGISEELPEEGGYSDLQQGTAELGVTNTPFASKMYNLVNQLLFSLKADAVANRVIENLKNGFKPVISFTNTMEGFLDEAPKDTPMDKVPNFSATLMRALDGVMRYTETNLKGEKENKFFTVNDLPEAGQNKYYEIREKIENLSADLPISPMDAIKMKIQKAGYKVGEITGRTLEMVQDENGKYVIQNRKDRDKKSAARDFNNGQLDVLMVNKSGSTGISLHASPKFEDQRQRVMVFAQFQSDINDEVQMRGRIDRTGQKFRGKYEYIMSSIPAEQRLQMMFKAKLKSLDANTTSSQKSKFNEMEVVDYLNKYGDDVTWQYMLEHPELSEKLGDPLKILTSEGEEAQSGDTNTAGKEGCAAKIARYLPFLPVKEQEEVFKDITEAYNVKIQLLNDAGENDLEITTMPLKAKTISKKIWKPGTDPNSGNAFADNTYLEEVEVDVLKKPMKAEEIKSTVSRMTSGEPFNEWLDNRVKEINSLYDGKIATLKERLDQSALERSEKAKKNYIEKSKEARKNGKNEFTDEEIEKMSEVVVEDIMKKSKESFIKQKNVIEARRENIRKQINSFTPMKPLVIPFNLDETLVTIMPSRGMFLGYKFSKDYSPSSSTAIFATLDGRRKVEIPLNQEKAFNSIRMNTMMQPTYLKDLNVDTWDSYVPTQTRKKAYIVTGNLLQALVDTKKSENVKGYLVSYSTIEGDTKQGILMSDNFKPENLTTSAPISSRLIQIQQGETVISEDKRVIVEKNTGWRSGYALKVPKSKKQGGEFFEDNKLRSLADNKEFTTRGNYMVADISSDNLSKVLDRLSKMGVTVSKKAKLENSEDVRFRENDIVKISGGRNIKFTRKNPTNTFNALVKYLESEDIKINDISKAKTGSKYVSFEINGVSYDVRAANHTKGYYGKHENSTGVTVYWKDNINGIDVDLSENEMGIDDIKQLISDVEKFNSNENISYNSFIEKRENPYDFIGENSVLANQMLKDMVYDLKKEKENLSDNNTEEIEKINNLISQASQKDFSPLTREEETSNLYNAKGNTEIFNISDVEETSKKLNVPVEVITSVDQIKDNSVRSAIEKGRKVKGWYSLSDNKVYVYLPNATSMEDVNQTILHEGVAHYGLRQLVGEDRMDDFLDDVFANVTDEVRKKIIDTLPRYGYNSRIATEEYMARMAENGVDVSVWQRIKQAFNSLMRRMGINIKISDNELRYILWRSRQNLDKNKPLDLAKDVAMQYQMGVGNYFREDTDGSIGMYEQSLKGWKYKAQEAYQDSMLALKNLQEVIAKVSGKPIKSFENAYMAENQLSSKNTSEAEVYYKKHYQPMLQEAGKMMKKYGLTQKGIERYMMLAHGIERNVELTFREQLDEVIKNNPDDADQFIQDFKDEKERLRKLYSGYEYLKELSDYIGGVNDYSATQAILNSMDGEEHDNFQEDALNYVKDFEQTYDVKELWNKTNDATKTTLRKAYDSGMMGKEQYSNVNNMYMYYVPLRGWDEQTAEDVYEYIDSERNPVSSVLKSAKGRKSIPDEIFATIGNMAESAIMQGNRNMMKQSFMSMVINHPTDIAALKKAWYVYDPVKDEWNISMPDIQESDNAETIAEKLKNHEEQMKQLKENRLATQKPNGLNINYRINKNNISQHVVQVKNGGKDYVIYINGNPRAAQAINGLTNPNVEQNPIFRSIATANRWLAANFTTRNPAFVLSNLVRDLIFSNVAVSIKEDGKYSSRFRKNILKAMPVVLRNLNGKPNNTEADRYFQEFIENGGETGYMHLNDVEKYKKKVRKELSKINGEMGSAKMAMDFAIDRLEDFNRWAEDISRFTTYMTSRQMGRSITESVNDAKEVTVNFNKKGAGYKTGGFFGITSGIFRNLYLFFNASVQSLTNFKRLYDKQPVKFYSALGGFMSAGFLMPMINNVLYSIFGGGDDDPYNDLPEWVRRNNLCIYTGDDTFLTIPLPIELRAFYGLGDYAYQLTTGKEKPSATNIAKGTVGQLADLLPLNPTGNEGLKTFMPDIMSPIFEAYVWNQDFTGKPVAKISPFNERDPEWKRVYKGTSGWLVDTSKFLNDISNGSGPGSEFRKGFIDFNPAKVEHLLESYFGGMAKTFNQAGKTIYYGGKSLIEQQKDEDLVMRNVPIANRFLNTVDERNAFSGINTEYFNLRDEMDQFKYELNGVKKSGNKDEYKEMLNSDLYDKYQKYKPYQKKLKKLNDMAKESQGEDRKEIEDMIIETRRELLEEVK